MHDAFVALIIVSHLLRGLYSWLIKNIPTNLSTQLLIRMLTFTFAALSLGLMSSFTPSFTHLLTMGALNTVHILSSYYAYSQLPTTVSLPLFYLYPIINVLFSSVFLKTQLFSTLPWLLFSLSGAVLMVFQTGKLSFSLPGILSILVSAITESLIYVVFKSKYEPNQFQGLFHLYCGGLIAVLIGRATNLLEPFEFKPEVWTPLLLFNLFVGFVSFSIVMYTIPRMSPELFASLAFFGVLSGFIFGELGNEEKPSIPTTLGAIMIVIGAAAVRYLKIDTS